MRTVCGLVMFCIGLFAAVELAIAGEQTNKSSSAKATVEVHRYTNRLADSNDSYLLLHAHNPVDWYPWGPEALAKAKRENKPIFLSVGYSTCYWCRVAEETIYSKPEFAKLMNTQFVNIKVDREQRPDLDRLYMTARQLLTGSGGWPNNLFLTPDLKPFYAGSYFPPHDDGSGRLSFSTVLISVHHTWQDNPKSILETGEQVYAALKQYQTQSTGAASVLVKPKKLLADAVSSVMRRLDGKYGGFSSSSGTKFPQEPFLQLLLTSYQERSNPRELEALKKALDGMAYGGIYDHLGWGFHRYSTEPTWSVPHFEKMLYDNAQLVRIYAEAYRATHHSLYRQITFQVADYLTHQMMALEGGFYTAEDAQVGGEEGASYVWTRKEINSVLGTGAAKTFFKVYTLTPMPEQHIVKSIKKASKQEGVSGVLRIRLPIRETLKRAHAKKVTQMLSAFDPLRKKLLAARNHRPQPWRDEKIISGLNGLTIEGLAVSSRILNRPDYLVAAKRAAERIWSAAYNTKTGELKHELFNGQAQTDGYLDDYALLGRGYLALFEASGESVWRDRAVNLAENMLKRFQRADGTLATTTDEKKLLIALPDDGDNVVPSGTSAAIDLLLRLASATGKANYVDAASRAIDHLSARLAQAPVAWPSLISALNVNKPILGAVTKPVSGIQARSSKFQSLDTADFVRASGTTSMKSDHEEILITLVIAGEYHLNANPATYNYLIPTSVSFQELIPQRISYPPAVLFKSAFAHDRLKVYEGTVKLVTQVAKGTLKKGQTIHATVAAQACNKEICLPPAKLLVDIAP